MARFVRHITSRGVEYWRQDASERHEAAALVLPYPRCVSDRSWEVAVVSALLDAPGDTFVDDDHPTAGPFELGAFVTHLGADVRGRVSGRDPRWGA